MFYFISFSPSSSLLTPYLPHPASLPPLKERSDTYSISAPTSEWVPFETVSITIAVEKKRIQRRQNKGVYTCYCDRPYRHRLVNDCTPKVRSASEHERSREPRAASGILAL